MPVYPGALRFARHPPDDKRSAEWRFELRKAKFTTNRLIFPSKRYSEPTAERAK
jgi:hypothetical protein